MKTLAVVTATLDTDRADSCLSSWMAQAASPFELYVVRQASGTARGWYGPRGGGHLYQYWSPEVLGVVPAFAIGVQKALDDGADIIACLHDDLEIQEAGWDTRVTHIFKACPRAGLCGFGGGQGLGDADIYQTPYNPMQLARKGFVSNMRDAEAHGVRSRAEQPVACLDGFSQIGLASFWLGQPRDPNGWGVKGTDGTATTNLFSVMEQAGIIHHAYDAALGAFAKQLGYQVWFVPVACHHYGGRTAVGDARYQTWAQQYQYEDADTGRGGQGDQGFWEKSHRVVYELFRGVLPIRT